MILGLESSCDESAIALFDPLKGIVGEWIHSQISKHAEYGGVVPDIAVRQHLDQFFPLLEKMRIETSELGEVKEIAVTCGPGLIGCLGVGISIAKTLGQLWGLPVQGVNHLRSHAYSPFIQLGPQFSSWNDFLPHLGLLVSGGNTLLFEIREDQNIKIIARTTDDAVGEALDKGAKLLGIAYPGGAQLERDALEGNPEAYSFPRAFHSKNSDREFSFSGLKTSLLYQLQKMNQVEVEKNYADLCSSYQEAAVDQLTTKCKRFFNRKEYKSFGLSGGVANNQVLRDRFQKLCHEEGVTFLATEKKHAGDNAAMIAYAAYQDRNGLWPNEKGELNFNPGLSLDDIPSNYPTN